MKGSISPSVVYGPLASGLLGSRFKMQIPGDFPGGPVVKNSPCNEGDMGSIHDKGLRSLLYAMKQLSCATARKSVH